MIPIRIAGDSIVGRSGINLDSFGYLSDSCCTTAWVIDGVSPIILSSIDRWKFRDFYTATEIVNQKMMKSDWSDVPKRFNEIATLISSEESLKKIFSDKRLSMRPLFSIAFVKVQKIKGSYRVDYELYGDCFISIYHNDGLSIIENKEIEDLKKRLDRLFGSIVFNLSISLNTCLKKLTFILIRFFQIRFGMHRVYCISNHRPAEVRGGFVTADLQRIVIGSDGLSWCLKNEKVRKNFEQSLKNDTCTQILETVREHESMNSGFGNHDDSTIVKLDFV
ncbi:MAG: hypothetical protein WD077_12695 [Bacteroidia bacterium]